MDKMLLPTAFVQQLHRHVPKIQQLMLIGKLVNMAMAFLMLSTGLVLVNGSTPGNKLSSYYYDGLCPGFATKDFQSLTDAVVAAKVAADGTLPPSLMRLAFHDCFVRGCDASVLLITTPGNVAEKDAIPNLSLRGFEVIDAVKVELERVCPGVFSCADIVQEVALAAQRYTVQPNPRSAWKLEYGRRDGRDSFASEVLPNIPSPALNLAGLEANFAQQGLNKRDLINLSGAHTFGVAHCIAFSRRLYNYSGNGFGTDPAYDPDFAASLKAQCPRDKPLNIVNLDVTTPTTFDKVYYNNLYKGLGLLTSDDTLKSDPLTVAASITPNLVFVKVNFATSMTKMTEIKVKLYPDGEIRSTCSLRN